MVLSEQQIQLLNELETELRKEARAKKQARQTILEEAKQGRFYPAYPPEQLLILSNGFLRRLCDKMTRQGLLEKHRNGEYQHDRGRELGIVYYTLKEA